MAALADSYKLEIEFLYSGSFGNAFVLDSSLLDTGRLSGLAFIDVTADVTQISVSRGRSRQLDSFDSATMNFTLRNNTRKYDPTNTAGPYFGSIEPRRRVRLSANSTYLYNGWIDDWNIDYSQPTESTVSASCVDAFSILASIQLDEFTFTDGERTDQRITTVLALPEVSGAGITTSLEAGDSTLADDTASLGTTVLDYLQRVNRSEQGYLFVNSDGNLRFRRRTTQYSGTIPVFQDTAPSLSSEFKYSGVGVQFGTELLFNRITVTNDGGSPQTVSNSVSEASYLTRTLDISDLILEDDAQALGIANFLLGKYALPEFRFDSVSLSLESVGTAGQNTLFAIEPNDLVQVKRTYTTGSPLTVEKFGIVEGIQHDISISEHKITFSLSPAQGTFRLDSSVFGVLDSNTLGI
jgi:hypothetical protein